MNITEELNKPGLLLIIDFEKAFESVFWDFINKILKFFNFGESIIKWVSVFYKNVIQNVFFCQNFFLYKEGVGRGPIVTLHIPPLSRNFGIDVKE